MDTLPPHCWGCGPRAGRAEGMCKTGQKNLAESVFLEEKSSKALCTHGHILNMELGSKQTESVFKTTAPTKPSKFKYILFQA